MKNQTVHFFYYCTLFLFIFILVLISNGCRKSTEKPIISTHIRTFAGLNEKFGEPFGIAIKDNEIYVSDGEKGKIWRVSPSGEMSVFADNLHTPSQISFDTQNNLIVADSGANVIRKIRPTGESEIVAGIENQSGFADGETSEALFNAPIGVAVVDDKIFVADTYNDRIRLIENGKVSTYAGGEQGFLDSENGLLAKFNTPCGIAFTKEGNLIVADTGNRRLRIIERSGKTSTFAGNGETDSVDDVLLNAKFVEPLAVTVGNSGQVYVADGNSIRVIGRRLVPFVETISDNERGLSDGLMKFAKVNRPSGLAIDQKGQIFFTDAENRLIRFFTTQEIGKEITAEEIKKLVPSSDEFRKSSEPRWTYNPPEKAREIAGTFGEIRGEISEKNEPAYFHNGLDIVGNFGEIARFIRSEKVLRPIAVYNFETARELIRMPYLGYVHISLGRDKEARIFDDNRFQFQFDSMKKPVGLRIPRGTRFEAGEAMGTLNTMNHVHLIAGGSGRELNALDALIFPNIADKIPPIIENISFFDRDWNQINEIKPSSGRLKLNGKIRIVVRAYDRMDGNAERRRLGVFSLGYQILKADQTPVAHEKTTISFAELPDDDYVKFVYAKGSQSGATGETIFNYIVTNETRGNFVEEQFLDTTNLEKNKYILRIFATDYFGNKTSKDIEFENTF